MKSVTVYSMHGCPYCEAAKALLQKRAVAFEEIKLAEEDDAAWTELSLRSGLKTMPQIFQGERLIGGFAELAKLDQIDSLVSLKIAG
ncbi:MAG: glutaredoxin domain-containing protein [Bdellovibrionota bacterium]